MKFSVNETKKTLKKAKSLTWDNSTWEAQILPSITKELEKLDVRENSKNFGNENPADRARASILAEMPGRMLSMNGAGDGGEEEPTYEYRDGLMHVKRRSQLGRTQSVRAMIPPPGFEEVEAKAESLQLHQDGAKGDGLKRCVTFAGVIPKHYMNGGRMGKSKPAAKQQSSGNDAAGLSGIHEASRTLRRIDSAKMVRQAFPKTIFDNSDDPSTGGVSHERTKSDTYFSGFDEALTGMGDVQVDDPMRLRQRSGSVSSLVSDASTNSTATSASNPILVTRGNYSGATTPTSMEGFGTPVNLNPGHGSVKEGNNGESFAGPQQYYQPQGKNWSGSSSSSSAGWNPQFAQGHPPPHPAQPQPQYMDPSVQAPGMNLNFPQMAHYPQNVQSPYAAGPYAGLDQQQQIQMIQQQVLHNQMMFRWMMQQQNLAQAQAQAQGGSAGGPPPPMQSSPHMAYAGWRGKPEAAGPPDRGYGGMNGNAAVQRGKFVNHKAKVETKRPTKGSLLLRHKNNGYRPTFAELVGNVVEFSRDSHGSRLVQYMMETATVEKRQVLLDEVMDEAVSLMQDLFGNYVIQNFLEHASPEQRIALASLIKGKTLALSLQPHGCRVVQRAIEVLPTRKRNELIEELLTSTPKVIRCAKDPHATHVLQKATVQLQRDIRANKLVEKNTTLLRQIEQAVADDVLILAVHPNACRLVQRVLGRCDIRASTFIAHIMTIVYASYHTLAIDQHGNFILQHILDNGSQSQVESVQSFVCSRVLELAQHKFGSHLVEKCLQSSTPAQAEAIVNELLQPTGHNEEYKNAKCEESEDYAGETTLLMLMKDPYANFVVQRAFDASPGFLRTRLAKEIREHSQVLNKFTYGRHILSHIGASEA